MIKTHPRVGSNRVVLFEITSENSTRKFATSRRDFAYQGHTYAAFPATLDGLSPSNRGFPDIFTIESDALQREFAELVNRSVVVRCVDPLDPSHCPHESYRIVSAVPNDDRTCITFRKIPSMPQDLRRFSRLHRFRRKLRRLANELRSVYEERCKSPFVKSWPVTVNLNQTTVCNLRCIMCQQAFGVPQKTIDPELYRIVRDELFDHASELDLTLMGETFCVPKPLLNEILDDVERYDLRFLTTTNATLFGSDEEIARFARLVTRLWISIDGATKKTFERIRVGANWEKTVRNIERFNEARERLPLYHRPTLFFQYVLMKSNLAELPHFIDHAKRWGAIGVCVYPAIEVHPSLRLEKIDESDPHVRQVVGVAKEKAIRLGVGLKTVGIPWDLPKTSPLGLVRRNFQSLRYVTRGLRSIFALDANFFYQRYLHHWHRAERDCPFLWNKVYVLVDGQTSTCEHPSFLLTGDLRKTSFREIWNGRKYTTLRRALNTDDVVAPCRDCHLLRD